MFQLRTSLQQHGPPTGKHAHENQPTAKHAPYCKLQNMPSIAKHAKYCKTCLLLQNMPPIAKHAPYCKTWPCCSDCSCTTRITSNSRKRPKHVAVYEHNCVRMHTIRSVSRTQIAVRDTYTRTKMGC